jgi:hypothetical protein
MALGFTQSLNINEYQKMFLGLKLVWRLADNLTSICVRTVDNVGTLKSRSIIGLHSLLQG